MTKVYKKGGSLRVAVATSGVTGLVDLHFGHAKSFFIYEVKDGSISFLEERELGAAYCQGEERLPHVIQLLKDCPFLICKRIGYPVAKELEGAGIKCVMSSGMIEEAILDVLSEMTKVYKKGGPLRVAVATSGVTGLVDLHFGHAKSFFIYEVKDGSISFLEEREVGAAYCQGEGECYEFEHLPHIIQLLKDCPFLICKRIGYPVAKELEGAGIKCVMSFGMIEDVIADVLNEKVFLVRP